MRFKMEKKLEEFLDEDERLLWKRLPGGRGLHGTLRIVQALGHISLTVISGLFAFYSPAPAAYRILLGLLLIGATNAPLLIWARFRLPRIGGSNDSLLFLTDRRVGLFRPNGEIRQAPICPGLGVSVNRQASIIEFSLGERTPVIFGGLNAEEILLVSSVIEGLIKKCE